MQSPALFAIDAMERPMFRRRGILNRLRGKSVGAEQKQCLSVVLDQIEPSARKSAEEADSDRSQRCAVRIDGRGLFPACRAPRPVRPGLGSGRRAGQDPVPDGRAALGQDRIGPQVPHRRSSPEVPGARVGPGHARGVREPDRRPSRPGARDEVEAAAAEVRRPLGARLRPDRQPARPPRGQGHQGLRGARHRGLRGPVGAVRGRCRSSP